MKTGTLRKIFDTTSREVKLEYPQVTNDLKTDLLVEKDQRLAGLSPASEIVEGENIPLQGPVYGGQKSYTQRYFGTGFRMTWQMDFFNKYKLWQKWAKDLGQVMKETKDTEVAVMFNNMTSTSLTCGTGFDSLAIANDTHTGLLDGSTADNYDNYLNADLSVSSIADARYYFAMLKNDLGVWMGATPTTLVIHPNLYITAKEIFGTEGKPHELSNTINVLPEMGLKIFEYHRLTGTTTWFMIAKNGNYDFNVFTSKEPDFVEKDAPDNTRDRIITSMQAFTYGWGDPRRLFCGKAS